MRAIRVRSELGDIVLLMPLTAGAIAGGLIVLTAPWLALLAAIAGVIAKMRIDVTYDGPETGETNSEESHD